MKAKHVLLSVICWLGLSTASIAETISAKIVSGNSVVSAPSWMTALWIDTGSETGFCGGTLVDSQWVMTAAHCVYGTTSSTVITAMIGQTDISTYPNNIATVDAIYVYPVILPFLTAVKSRGYAAINGGLPPLALCGRS